MATSDPPPEDDDLDHKGKLVKQVHPQNSWRVSPPAVEPHCAAYPIPIPEPLVPFALSLNDKRFLRSIKIDPD